MILGDEEKKKRGDMSADLRVHCTIAWIEKIHVLMQIVEGDGEERRRVRRDFVTMMTEGSKRLFFSGCLK